MAGEEPSKNHNNTKFIKLKKNIHLSDFLMKASGLTGFKLL